MLFAYIGTDRKKAKDKLNEAVRAAAKKKNARITRISDSHAAYDLRAALQGAGMFGERRIVVLDETLLNEDMREIVLSSFDSMQKSQEDFFIFEENPTADARRAIEKAADGSFHFDALKQKETKTIFALVNPLRRADKKALWVAYQRELLSGESPEAIHGVLFWGAKDAFLKSREGSEERQRASALVAELAELPHKARRNSFDLEYALEKFVLSVA